jgi:Ca2+-binding RTX toxin-like protein
MATINGTTGNDKLYGTGTDDLINGGAGNDTILAGDGDDVIDGGDGDDVITAGFGNQRIVGGAGNDQINLRESVQSGMFSIRTRHEINAGSGNDLVRIESDLGGSIVVDLGIGDDVFIIDRLRGSQPELTLGAGRDTVVLGTRFLPLQQGDGNIVVINDFAAGDGGDTIDLSLFVRDILVRSIGPASVPDANPFASGHLRLVQDGADVLIQSDFNGNGPGQVELTIARLRNVDLAQLTAANFGGYDPAGAAPATGVRGGTAVGDFLVASAIGGTLNGLGGDDLLFGSTGNDVLNGDGGNDRITGGFGDDLLSGGDGNDQLSDADGDDAFNGGAGDDQIDIVRYSIDIRLEARTDQISVSGGDGNDRVTAVFNTATETGIPGLRRDGRLTVDLGAGDDFFSQSGRATSILTLGSGRDTVELLSDFTSSTDGIAATITDFAAGPGGDILDLNRLLSLAAGGTGPQSWAEGSNPFASGHLRLERDGNDTLVLFDYDGFGGNDNFVYVVARLQGVLPGQLTADNFTGYAPDEAAVAPLTLTGTTGADTLVGGGANDTINGGDGNDRLNGGFGGDTLSGGNGDDILESGGGIGTDNLSGGIGNDTLIATGGGADILSGGDGHDHIVITRSGRITPMPSELVTVTGGAGNDLVEFTGGTGRLLVDLGSGDDRIILNSVISAGLAAGDGIQITTGTGRDTVELGIGIFGTGTGDVVITDFTTGATGDRLEWLGLAIQRTFDDFFRDNYPVTSLSGFNPFATGQATLTQSGADTILRFDRYQVIFRNTTATSFTAENLGIDPLHATQPATTGNDMLTGTAGRDYFYGQAGNDQLSGGDGDDVLWGQAGNDTLNGGIGNDIVDGGIGDDVLNGGDGNDYIVGIGKDQIDGGAGDDTIYDTAMSTIVAGTGNDVIRLNVAFDLTQNPAGLGSLQAGDGNDVLAGTRIAGALIDVFSRGSYSVNMGAGDDYVVDFAGTITLGTGRDTVERVRGAITDFQTGNGGDIYDLTDYSYFANVGGASTFEYLGLNPFAAGILRLVQQGANVILQSAPFGFNAGFAPDTIVTFRNTTVAQFTAENFGGYDPHARNPVTTTFRNTATIDANRTYQMDNPMVHYDNIGTVAFLPTATSTIVNNGTILFNITGTYPGVSPFATTATAMVARTGSTASALSNGVDGEIRANVSATIADGSVIADEFQVFATGLNLTGEFTNRGLISAHSAMGGTAVGASYSGILHNSGTIESTSAYMAVGVTVAAGSQLDNTGTIRAEGDYLAVAVNAAELAMDRGLHNAGTIIARTDASSPYASIGFLVGSSSIASSPLIWSNSGQVTADIAYYFIDSSNNGIAETLNNSGTITGTIFMNRGHDTLINSGFITGDMRLGNGNDVYDGAAGQMDGAVWGGNGNDTLYGGQGADALLGGAGTDVIIAGGGDDYVEGGVGSDTLDGGAGTDILSYFYSSSAVTANLALGTIIGGGSTDYVRNFEFFVGSQANDVIVGSSLGERIYGEGGNDQIDGGGGSDILFGGAGVDTLTGGNGNDTFEFQAGGGHDVVTDFANGDRISIYGYAAAIAIEQSGADAVIRLSANDSLVLRNTDAASLTAANLSFKGAVAPIQTPRFVFDTIEADSNLVLEAGTQIVLGDTGSENPLFADTRSIGIVQQGPNFEASLWNGGTFRLNTTLPDLLTIGASGLWNNFVNQAGAIFEVTAQNSSALGASHFYSVWNAGQIRVTSNDGDAAAFIDINSQQGVFVNSGTIAVTATGHASGAVQDRNSGSPDLYFNSGSITVSGGEGATALGIYAPYRGDVDVVNAGTLTANDNGAPGASVAIEFGAFYSLSEVWNRGTINGDYAIRVVDLNFYEQFEQEVGLRVYNSGTINGAVALSNYADVVVNSNMINGRVQMGGSDDLFDGRTGRLNGDLSGGTGNDTLLTGAGDNNLFGDTGDDILSGGAGADTLTGGAGRDSFRFETGFGNDIVTDFQTGSAHDYIDVAGYTAYQSITQSGSDVLIRFSATDSLLIRGTTVAAITPAMIRFGAAPIAAPPVPTAPVAPAAPPPVTASDLARPFAPVLGTSGNDAMTGSAAPDDLRGLDGHDTLNGMGGSDYLYGGLGNDVYHVDIATDLIFEAAGEGNDTAIATAGFYLYANVENLTLAGSSNIFGVGNGLANTILGNTGSNLLLGGGGDDIVRGGAGIDSLFGEDGADQLFGDAGVDYLVGGIGNDVIDGGADADALYGEDGDDTLIGGTGFHTDILVGGFGNDILRGDSGLGDYDLMDGGTGDDAYYVDTPSDLTFEMGPGFGGGTDTVYANINGAGYYLYANVENLVLLGNTPFGVGNELDNRLTGNAAGNYLLGGAGYDVLNGKGGNDVLFGEGDSDIFVFERGTGADVVGDFMHGQDRIDLSAFGFASFAALQASFSQVGNDGAINLGNGDLIVLHGVTMSELTQGDFILTASAPKIDDDAETAKIAEASALADADAGSSALDWLPDHWMPHYRTGDHLGFA